MKITLSIPDDLFDIYAREAAERLTDPGNVIRQRLIKAVGLDPRERPIILTGGQVMQQIEERLGGGNLRDGQDLLNKITKLASVKFGEHEFKITPGQFRELAFRATKTGRTPEQLIETMYQKMSQVFWEYVP